MSILTQASLVLTPNAVKTSKLYSIIPSNGNGDMDVVRATTATRVNSSGIIESVAANVARLNYDGSCPSILVEPQRTNLDPNSQTFVGWTLNNSAGVTTSAVTATNPYDFSTVQKVIPTAALGQHRPLLSVNYTANGRIWVIAKADGYNFLSLGEGGGVNGSSIIFNLSDGTISGSQAGYTASIISLGNGWYKCSINTVFTGSILKVIVIRNNNTISDYIGDGTSGVLIAHKQLEVGEYDTTSILTNGAIATRNADVITRNNIYTNGLITSLGGTWFIELNNNLSLTRSIAGNGIWIGDNNTSSTTGNSFNIRHNGGTARLSINKAVGGTLTPLYTTLTNTVKIAIDWNGTTADVFVNGVKVVTGTAFTTTNMEFLNTDGLGDVPKYIKSMMLFPKPLTDSECIALTTL